MQFSLIALTAAMATFVAASPIAEASPAAAAMRRAIKKAYFSEAELADANPGTCCCCVPPNQITNVDHLHRLIAASQ